MSYLNLFREDIQVDIEGECLKREEGQLVNTGSKALHSDPKLTKGRTNSVYFFIQYILMQEAMNKFKKL